jgi:hypothetical protein
VYTQVRSSELAGSQLFHFSDEVPSMAVCEQDLFGQLMFLASTGHGDLQLAG